MGIYTLVVIGILFYLFISLIGPKTRFSQNIKLNSLFRSVSKKSEKLTGRMGFMGWVYLVVGILILFFLMLVYSSLK